jgi:succinyl-diaminopimelate desuccinylase
MVPASLDLTAGVVSLTRQLCDIESVSGNETTIADAIERSLTGLAHLTVTRFGNTIVARTDRGNDTRVAIAGHIDTVPLNDNLPTRLELDGGVQYLWGRGTVDMKAGVAVQLLLAVELAEPTIDVTWIFYDGEEVESSRNGLGHVARDAPELLAADFAILGEPSSAGIEGGCNGTLRFDLRTKGTRAHAARPWMGHNAIHDLAPILGLLAAYEPREIDVDGLVYRESLNAVTISGGVATNVIPDAASVHVNYRFAPDKTAAQAEAYVRDLFTGYDFDLVDVGEAARPGLTSAIAQRFIAAVGAEPKPKYGWTDVARFSALGIPAVNFGPGDPSLAHADNERVPTAQIEACEQSLRAWLTS